MLKNFWYAICLSTEVKEKPMLVTALGQELVVYRNHKQQAIAMSNLCIHRGGSLSSGLVKNDCVVCPYHGWEYQSDGVCVKIPSYQEEIQIPLKARIDSYPTEEKYGFIWAFLGDLSESERPPLPLFPECDNSKYRKLWGDYHWDVHYTRALENGMDIAHAPFVHAGSFGNRDEPEVESYVVEQFEWGSDATVNLNPPPLSGLWSLLSKGKERPPVKTTSGYRMPNITPLQVTLPIGEFVLYVCHLPVSETHTRSLWVQMRSFFTSKLFDRDSMRRVIKIFDEDRQTVSEQRPQILPYDLAAELHVRSDAIQIDFRKKRNKYIDLGWCIDSQRIQSEYANKAVVIPSPARKENPNAWIMDEVPVKQIS